jgi:hypothetical protein
LNYATRRCRRKIEMTPGVQSRNDTALWSGSGGGRARSSSIAQRPTGARFCRSAGTGGADPKTQVNRQNNATRDGQTRGKHASRAVHRPNPLLRRKDFQFAWLRLPSAQLLPYKSREPSHLISNPVEFAALETPVARSWRMFSGGVLG